MIDFTTMSVCVFVSTDELRSILSISTNLGNGCEVLLEAMKTMETVSFCCCCCCFAGSVVALSNNLSVIYLFYIGPFPCVFMCPLIA